MTTPKKRRVHAAPQSEPPTLTNPTSNEHVIASKVHLDVPAAWIDRLLVATTALPVQEGEDAVALAIVTALSEIAPHGAVGVCLVRPPDSRPQSSLSRTSEAEGVPAQRVFHFVPLGEEDRTVGVDPTRLFPGFLHERVVEAELGGTTIHVASDHAPDLADGGAFGHIVARAADALGRGLHFARVHKKAMTDAADLRALSSHMVQAEKLASLGQLAAGVVHELNNPLTSIVAYTDYLVKRAATNGTAPEDLERLQRIEESAKRMLRFTRDLVAYARPSREVPVPVSIHGVIDQALAFCEHTLDKAHVTVERRFVTAGGRPVQVRGMHEQLAQVFVNLVTNACHAMPEADATLFVSTHLDVNHVVVRVEDNGTGIAEEHLGQIFVPFFTTKSDGDGTGLGLSIVKNIVDNHRGEIWAENRHPRGTRFVILLPLLPE